MKRVVFCVVLVLLMPPSPRAFADNDGKLEQVEQGTSEPKASDTARDTARYATARDGFLETLFYFLLAGLFRDYSDRGLSAREFHAMLKHDAQPALPTFRFEGNYSKVLGDDVHAYRLNALAGYLAVAGEFDWVHYFEQTPTAQLRIMSPRLLFRSAPSSVFEINVALGAKILSGRRTQAGAEFGLPIYFFLGKHAIIDIKNYYSAIQGANVYDFAGGISGKWKLAGARAAYRYIRVGSESIHGPEVGLFVQW